MNTDFIHWYGQAAVRIEDGKTQIYIDPFNLPSGELAKADIILITHSHRDHYSPDDIERIRKSETIFVVPEDSSITLKGNIRIIKPDQSIEVGKVKISTIPAYNPQKQFHPKSNNWVGYILSLSNKLTIYHAGDTDLTPEMKNVKVDVALVPIGGKYTMTASEAAEAINIIQPKVSIPMHYGGIVGTEKDAQTFKKEVKSYVVIKQQEK